MIFDAIDNLRRYTSVNKGFAAANEFLFRPDIKELTSGKHEIDGESVYAIVSEGPGRRKEDSLLEIHNRYVDIQLILSGTDNMGWKPAALCSQPCGEYDQKTDVQFFSDEPDAWISVKSGAFAIFFHEDAHMPLVSSGSIRKVVVKVLAH